VRMTRDGFSASMVERMDATDRMSFGGSRPAHLPSANVWRGAKHGELKNNHLHGDPVIAICIAKKMADFIQNVGYDKFFVHYWSSLQLHVYNEYCRKTSFRVGGLRLYLGGGYRETNTGRYSADSRSER
jgi:hypothetical protein